MWENVKIQDMLGFYIIPDLWKRTLTLSWLCGNQGNKIVLLQSPLMEPVTLRTPSQETVGTIPVKRQIGIFRCFPITSFCAKLLPVALVYI